MEGNYLQVFAERTPQKSAVKSSYIQKCAIFGSSKKGLFKDTENLNDTSMYHPGDVCNSHINEKSMSSISGVFELDTSKVPDSCFSNKFNSTYATNDSTNMNTTTLLDVENPAINYTDSLYGEFLEFFLSYSGKHEIFNLLLNYEELCCNQITNLRSIVKKTASAETRFFGSINMVKFLQEERNTWRLLRSLFQDRLETKDVNEEDIMMDTLGKRVSDKEIADNLYQKNAKIRQCQIVIDWLEKNAGDDFHDTYFDKLEYFSDHCVSWENTLHELTIHGIGREKNNGTIVQEVDPDASMRLKKSVFHEADKENEARLLKYMFHCIRAGDLIHAQQLAERFGEPWLATALEGWRLFHDPNYNNEKSVEGEALLPIEGNKYRDIWKLATWELSQKSAIPVYEKAIYGSFSGNLKAILPVCDTWEDHLWAYVKTLVDKEIEQELRSGTQFETMLEELPAEYWDKLLDLDQVFKEIQANESASVKSEATSTLRVMQKYIILSDTDGLIEEMHGRLKDNQGPRMHTLRCMVHVILFLRVIGHSSKEELCSSIIEAYIQELISARKVSLIAPYTSTLPKLLQIRWYAKFLESITDNIERQQCLRYAEDCGLDTPEITKTVVENIRSKEDDKSSNQTFENLCAETTEEDEHKISAIDWLIFDPSQRAEAMKQANALLRRFVSQKKIEAAKELFAKIPEDSCALMLRFANLKGLSEMSAEDDNSAREYLCFKAYLEAMEAFNDWFRHFRNSKPVLPPPPTGDNVRFKDKVAYEHEEKQYQVDLERWNSVLMSLGSMASSCLYNVLLFLNGGWMVDQRLEENVNEDRKLQMSLLRKLCIPHVTRLLQTVLYNEGKFKEAVQLADIIACEQYQLYKEFSREDLHNFLSMTLESSLALLDDNLDPLGYTFQ